MCDSSDIYYDIGSDGSSDGGDRDGGDGSRDNEDSGDTTTIYSHSLPSLD